MARPRAQTSIEIHAPLDLVWSVTLDFARYPEWNPFIVRVVDAPAVPALGAWFKLHVKWSSGKGTVSDEVFSGLEPPTHDKTAPRRARLEYTFGGFLARAYLVRGSREQLFSEDSPGVTRYETREEFRGLLRAAVPLADVQDGFERHARALKARSESLSRATS